MEVVHPGWSLDVGGCEANQTTGATRLNSHRNAGTTPHSREAMVRRVVNQSQRAPEFAAAFGVSAGASVRNQHVAVAGVSIGGPDHALNTLLRRNMERVKYFVFTLTLELLENHYL